jgi:hypothetical protein
MRETIEEIAKKILKHRRLELDNFYPNKAISRSKVKYNGRETQFWLTNKENLGGVEFLKDITGSVVGSQVGNRTTEIDDGKPIYKNTKLGEILIRNHEGIHTNQTPNKESITFEIFNRATYKPSDNKNEIAIDLVIQIANEPNKFSFRSLFEILQETARRQKEIDDLEKQRINADEQEANNLIIRIRDKENEKKAFQEKTQNFIRKYAELRYQPVIDPIQDKIKRSNIFDGTLIINGGPGTGKTTTLIQRIKFLIDISKDEVRNDYLPNLSKSQKEKLSDQKNSWIFFSPSELLALFLKNNMVEEGLLANDERVKVWANYKKELIRGYHLVNAETKKPFLFFNNNKLIEKSLYPTNAKKLKKISLDISPFKWKNTGLSIQSYINQHKGTYGIESLIRLFVNLNDTFEKEVKDISNEYNGLIKKIASLIIVSIQKDFDRTKKIEELLKKWKNETQNIEEDEDEDEEIDKEDFEETENNFSADFEESLLSKIKSLARKQALRIYDKQTKLSKRDRELLENISELQEHPDFDELGQLGIFKKYFERISKGLINNILTEILMFSKVIALKN